MTKQTGFHERWSALTRNVTEYRGYWLPTCFTNEGAVAEYWACREKAAIMDLSPLRKWEILGPDAGRARPVRGHARHHAAQRRAGRLHGRCATRRAG